MDFGIKSDKGRCREKNEDSCMELWQKGFFAVADGVGGGNSGEIASCQALESLVEYLEEYNIDQVEVKDLERFLRDAFDSVNKRVLGTSLTDINCRGMATTLVTVYIRGRVAYFCNVGDSRAYICRKGRIVQVTEDHTYVNTLLRAGIISKKQAKNHEDKNAITRAIGADIGVNLDFFAMDIKAEDIIILCSDGLYGELTDKDIMKVVTGSQTMEEAVTKLVEEANNMGGRDNISAICIKVSEEDL